MGMTIEIYEALVAANVPADKAKAVALAIEAAIERRCRMHESRMAGADGTAGSGAASSSGPVALRK